MKKFFCLVFLFFLCGFQVSLAEQTIDNSPEALLERFKVQRSTIYSCLNLTTAQAEEIKNLDEKIYKELNPELVQISECITRIDALAKSKDCTIKSVNLIKKDFKSTEKNISAIKRDYEKEFKKILTKDQKKLYKTTKKEQNKKLKDEIERLRNNEQS